MYYIYIIYIDIIYTLLNYIYICKLQFSIATGNWDLLHMGMGQKPAFLPSENSWHIQDSSELGLALAGTTNVKQSSKGTTGRSNIIQKKMQF